MSFARAAWPPTAETACSMGVIFPVKHSFIRISSATWLLPAHDNVEHKAMLEELTQQQKAKRVREAIEIIGKPQKDLAKLYGVSPQAITGWRKNGSMSPKFMWQLALDAKRPIEFFMFQDWETAEEIRKRFA